MLPRPTLDPIRESDLSIQSSGAVDAGIGRCALAMLRVAWTAQPDRRERQGAHVDPRHQTASPSVRRSRQAVVALVTFRSLVGALPAIGLATFIGLWIASVPTPVAACTGGDAPLAIGIRGASAIFFARIQSETLSSVGFYTLDLAVGRVIRGQPQRHVTHLVTPRACDELFAGDAGVVVLGSVNPFGVGPNDLYNFFYVLGPGHTSAADAAQVLAALPATDTALPIGTPHATSEPVPVAVLAGGLAGFLVLARRTRRRPPT